MEVRLLLPLFLLHGVPLFCAMNGDNIMEDFLVDKHTVTPRPFTIQNITTRSAVLDSDRTAQELLPPPRTYILTCGSGKICLRIKANYIVMIHTTKPKNVTIRSPSIEYVYGYYDDFAVRLVFIFPNGELRLQFNKNDMGNLFYPAVIWFCYPEYIGKGDNNRCAYVYLKTIVTPHENYFTSKEVNFKLSPTVSFVLRDVKVRAFEVNGSNFGNENEWNSPFDNLTTFVRGDYYDILEWYYNSSGHWIAIKLAPSINTVVFIVAFPLNFMAIVMFLVKMKVRKPAVVYMVNLATADLLLVSILPFHIAYRFLGSNWIFGEGMCRFVMAVFYCNMCCSFLLMSCISVDRFLAVVYPVRTLSWRTVKRAWLVCGVIWVISLASFVPLLIKEQIARIDVLNIAFCQAPNYEDFTSFYFFYGTAVLFFFLLQLCIITFCYIRIICSLSSSEIDGTHKRSRAIRLIVVVLSVLVLCFGPTIVVYLIHYVNIYKNNDYSMFIPYMLCTSISTINCCLDPLIYYFASSECQAYVYNLLRCKKNNAHK